MRLDESIFDRREFLNGVIGAGAAGLGATGVAACVEYLGGMPAPEPSHIIVSGQAMKTLADGRFVLVPYGPHPIMILQLPDGGLRALSAVCTHAQCNLRYRPESNDIYCACHHGRFTVEGDNVPGTPPPRPLRKFIVSRQNDGTLMVAAEPSDPDAVPRTDDQPRNT